MNTFFGNTVKHPASTIRLITLSLNGAHPCGSHTPRIWPHSCFNARYMTNNNRQNKGFLGQIFDNLKEELDKSKEMKENLRKFREEAQKLEDSEALKKARKKFQNIEAETSKGSKQIIEQIDTIKQKLSKGLEDASKTDIGKKGKEAAEELSKQAKKAAEQIEQISKSDAFQTVSKTVQTVKEEIGETPLSTARFYQPPDKLRKRKEYSDQFVSSRPIQPNEEATGVELHKDSKWFSSWQNFKDNNPYVNKIFEMKTKLDESDNPLVRASRLVTDKMTELFGGMFTKTELSEVLTEICKVDPNFDRQQFIKECETDIIPNILEAILRGDLEVLNDWCYEGVYNVLVTPIKQAQTMGYHFESKVIDLTNLELEMGKMMEQGPVLIITFQTQQIMCVKDSKGKVVEGDPEKIIRVHYVWVLCRDQNELDPKAAWRLLDLSANSAEQWL
ncbi:mitochondrial import inner membrane translocase subunit TIM44 isoform X3 [Dermatophagoides farinae]|uniref:Mitochondrial import inner membrane translocase subunit TIM44 n=1 Tax=Dermatophagoides farinae TaxID=6954 RepID=A0A922HRS6_DERFA|nr:mitochondrial import inner membrane translocase subunit TIM44-like [Dermatophagoides farinae]KAH7643615.1 mitochondrial import inner membrane translocase [Dermatophagoides farinae]KAH9506478.1 Mitochondrial import inner membrane translocase subunit TIM44 [Dermatophagoides farinae]